MFKVNFKIKAECQALLMAMQNAWCKGFQHVIFELDCKELHDLVQGCKKNLSYITGCVIWIIVGDGFNPSTKPIEQKAQSSKPN